MKTINKTIRNQPLQKNLSHRYTFITTFFLNYMRLTHNWYFRNVLNSSLTQESALSFNQPKYTVDVHGSPRPNHESEDNMKTHHLVDCADLAASGK